MGSSGTRKSNDTLRINKPATPSTKGGEGGAASGESTAPPDVNNLCPMRFRIKLKRQDVTPGTVLILNEDTRTLTAQGVGEVGKIDARTVKRLEVCAKLSIAYPTILTVIDRGACYAEFSQ